MKAKPKQANMQVFGKKYYPGLLAVIEQKRKEG